MSIELGALQSGLEALKQKEYQEAIRLLENFCKICQVDSQASFKEFIQAQMGLIKAYSCIGDKQKAIQLCQKLANSKNSQVQEWSKKTLISLSTSHIEKTQEKILPNPSDRDTSTPLTPEEAAELLKTANKALRFKKFALSVQAYEEYCQRAEPNQKDYEPAQTCLVKAYKGNEQIELAIALCKQLTNSKHESTQIWARQYLSNVLKVSDIPPEAADADDTKSPSSFTSASFVTLPSLEDFKIFCQQNLLSDLKELETSRQHTLKSIIFVGIIIGLLFCLLNWFLPINFIIFRIVRGDLPVLIIFLFLMGYLGCIWAWIAFYTSATETYANGFKPKVIQKIFDFINVNQTLKYSSCSTNEETEQTKNAFSHSQIFSSLVKPNRITQNDSIYGRVGDVSISFADILAEVEILHSWVKYFDFVEQMKFLSSWLPKFITRRIFILMLPLYITVALFKFIKAAPYLIGRMAQGRKIEYRSFEEEVLKNEVTRKPVFRGLFFQARFNKSFQSKTIIIPHLLNASIHALKVSKSKQVKLEDPEFSKLFIVYGDDQVEARYILSTNLMAKLTAFRKKARRNTYISFVDNMIYFAVEYQEDLFEPRLFQKMLSFAPLREFFEAIDLMVSIVKDLNLDRRIWKE